MTLAGSGNQGIAASLPILGAMKKYGLLIASGKEVRVSDDANTILLYPDGAAEATEVIKKLAMFPALFGEVLAKFPDGLPSDANLRARLQAEWGFASPKAADKFIEALREAVALTTREGIAGGGQVVDNCSQVIEEPSMTHAQESTLKQPSGAAIQQNPLIPSPRLPPTPSGTQSRPWNLGGGTIMTVTMPNALTPKNIEKLRKYVEALASEASIACDVEPDKDGQSES